MRASSSFVLLRALLGAAALLLAAGASAYSVSGSIGAYTNGPNGDYVERQDSFVDSTASWYDWGGVADNQQVATSGYFTHLGSGLVGAYAHASDAEPDSYSSAASAVTDARFDDLITFTVPAGFYPDGVTAVLEGFVVGRIDALGATGGLASIVRAFGDFSLGNQTFSFDETARGSGPTSIVIDESFALHALLIPPGQTVPAGGTEVNRSVSVYLKTYGTALHAYGYPNVPDASSMTGDIYGAGGFVSLSVPPGVGWSSESGVFLSQTDSDLDGHADDVDNCLLVPNRNQIDADGDGIGNLCDADLNQDCIVNTIDLGLLRQRFFSDDPVADFDSSGSVNAVDLGLMRMRFFQPPGPSASGICN